MEHQALAHARYLRVLLPAPAPVAQVLIAAVRLEAAIAAAVAAVAAAVTQAVPAVVAVEAVEVSLMAVVVKAWHFN